MKELILLISELGGMAYGHLYPILFTIIVIVRECANAYIEVHKSK